VFRSYGQKWNAVAPEGVQIQDLWPGFAAACIMVSELSGLNTTRWSFAEGTRGVATGFTGAVGFTLLPKRQCGEWAEYWDGADRVMQSLAKFAFYCGTGHHASIGMGQTRVLEPPRNG
jgi:CRISPR/Cas system endoribonuclease Cas6 (RAMP superfamily)